LVFELSPAEKLQLVADFWDDLASAPADVPVYDWQLEELEMRKFNLVKNPGSALSWDEVKKEVRSSEQDLRPTRDTLDLSRT
jgi:putative addiction module component (TIGR02574 family)